MARQTARKRVRDARAAMYRELIREAAEGVFAEHGYDAAPMAAIAKSSGVSLATVYASFESKWDLFCAVHAHHGQALLQHAGAAAQSNAARGVLAMVLDGVDRYVDYLAQNPNYLRMHLREGDAWAVAPKLRSEEQEHAFTQGMALAAQLFAHGITEGVFVNDDPELMARTMIAMHQVRLADWVAGDMQRPVEDLCAAMRDQLVRALCRPEVARDYFDGDES